MSPRYPIYEGWAAATGDYTEEESDLYEAAGDYYEKVWDRKTDFYWLIDAPTGRDLEARASHLTKLTIPMMYGPEPRLQRLFNIQLPNLDTLIFAQNCLFAYEGEHQDLLNAFTALLTHAPNLTTVHFPVIVPSHAEVLLEKWDGYENTIKGLKNVSMWGDTNTNPFFEKIGSTLQGVEELEIVAATPHQLSQIVGRSGNSLQTLHLRLDGEYGKTLRCSKQLEFALTDPAFLPQLANLRWVRIECERKHKPMLNRSAWHILYSLRNTLEHLELDTFGWEHDYLKISIDTAELPAHQPPLFPRLQYVQAGFIDENRSTEGPCIHTWVANNAPCLRRDKPYYSVCKRQCCARH